MDNSLYQFITVALAVCKKILNTVIFLCNNLSNHVEWLSLTIVKNPIFSIFTNIIYLYSSHVVETVQIMLFLKCHVTFLFCNREK